MVEIDLSSRRDSFTLTVRATLAAPWTVLYGPSGAGKTSLLRLIAGLDPLPHGGRVTIDGQPRNRLGPGGTHLGSAFDTPLGMDLGTPLDRNRGKNRAQGRGIGYASQQAALFPHLSVAANVAYGLSRMPTAARQERVHAMLALTGADALAQRSCRQLSGGEAQRVALARALAPNPRLLLLDEPISALDAAARDALLDRLQAALAAAYTQTILVTHDAADALATDAEVLLIQSGRVTAQGLARDILASERARLLDRLTVRSATALP